MTHRAPCPACRSQGRDNSGDNLAVYDDGHAHCHACGHHAGGDGGADPVAVHRALAERPSASLIEGGAITALRHRGISQDTCQKFGYVRKRLPDDTIIEIATYLKDGIPVGQKVRGPDKKFWTTGRMRDAPLWGQWLWAQGGKRLVVTEGEIDCMSVSQVQGNAWPVVSVPNGAGGAADAIRRELQWVCSFDEVVICLDMDEPGRKASVEVAQLLPPGKAKIASLPRKDANEMLVADEGEALKKCLWQASTYRPDGIIHVSEIRTVDDVDSIELWTFPWWGLTKFAIGQRPAEISMWTSGTGSGKSTIIRDITLDHLAHGRAVGVIMLEETPESTLDDIISVRLGKSVRRIRNLKAMNRLLRENGMPEDPLPIDYTPEEYAEAREWISKQSLYVYDHRSSRDDGSIETTIEYMAVSLGCRVVILDHITAAVAGRGNERTTERETLDKIMSALDRVVVRTKVHIHVICQLKKGDKAFEEGDVCTLQDLKGAGSLSTVPHNIWFGQRYCLDDDRAYANTTFLWCLKSRMAGDRRGLATALRFNPETHRFTEYECGRDDKGNPFVDEPVRQLRNETKNDHPDQPTDLL